MLFVLFCLFIIIPFLYLCRIINLPFSTISLLLIFLLSPILRYLLGVTRLSGIMLGELFSNWVNLLFFVAFFRNILFSDLMHVFRMLFLLLLIPMKDLIEVNEKVENSDNLSINKKKNDVESCSSCDSF